MHPVGPATLAFLKTELVRHKVALPGLPGTIATALQEKENPIVLPKADPKNADQIGGIFSSTGSLRSASI